MEENNKKIEKLKNDIKMLQNVYDNDMKSGKNEENDQIQANRQKGINKLQEELKEAEIEKLSKLEERKVELEEILKKKESLNKDKEQLEQAIYEMSGENEIQDGKLVKTQEQVEYEKDLEKVNEELGSLNIYENELSDVNSQIEELNEKYGINENHKQDNEVKKENEDLSKYENNEEKIYRPEEKQDVVNEVNYNDEVQGKQENEGISKDNDYEKQNLKSNNEVNYNQETYNENKNQPSQIYNNQINKEEKAITEYKKENRIIAWIKNRAHDIKEKFNSIKEKFVKSKNKEKVELNEVGQAWQDYIDTQEGKSGKESKTKGFKESLYVKGQQLKQSKIAKKLTRQNEKEKKANQFEAAKKLAEKHGMQQEDDEIDL